MAKAHFVMQGQKCNENHRLIIEQFKDLDSVKEVLISTAFLRSEGVELIKEMLNGLKENITIYIGIRNGITSIQGIDGLLDIGIKPYIVDTASNTFIFHPKTYMISNDIKAIAIVGSANLTMGGLVKNIEASNVVELDLLNNPDDKNYVDSMKDSFTYFRDKYTKNIIRITSKEESEKLYKEGKLEDENRRVHRSIRENASPDKTITPSMKIEVEDIKDKIKANVKKGLSDKTIIKKAIEHKISIDTSTSIENINVYTMEKVWESKALKERDLNIPTGENTHATGSMTLKKGAYDDIDQRTYFRNVVFNELTWVNEKNNYLEYAEAYFYVIVEGINYGKYKLKLKHDIRTNTKSYEQRNSMTHLVWNDAKQFIANRGLIGKTLKIYAIKPSDSEFVIEINDINDDDTIEIIKE